MATTNNFKRLLHRKQWALCSPPVAAHASGQTGVMSRTHNQLFYWLRGTALLDIYDPFNDAWGSMVTPALSTFAVGACMEHSAIGPTSTASAGSTTTLTTSLTIPIDLRGFQIRINSGPGAGDIRTIASNTIGPNSIITVTSAFSATITVSSNFTLLTGTLYLFGGGTLAASSFRAFDFATQTYSNLSITGLPATFGTDGVLTGTHSILGQGVINSFATGTATAGGASTLTNSGKNWAVNQWANAYQIRITAGTGIGQIRIIASNTATVITTSAAWTTQPDATSVYSIEGNDDYMYLAGNAALALYRYSKSGNTWTTLAPGAARAAVTGAGLSLGWIARSPETNWQNEDAILNGRRLYSFRGGASALLDYYDIPSNSWINGMTYGPVTIAITSGWKTLDYRGHMFIRNIGTTAPTALWYVYDAARNTLLPFNSFSLLSSGALVGQNAFIAEYIDGGTVIPYLYVGNDHTTFSQLMRAYLAT